MWIKTIDKEMRQGPDKGCWRFSRNDDGSQVRKLKERREVGILVYRGQKGVVRED